MPNNVNDTPSRLLKDSERIRYFLETRNLYTPNDPYNLFRGEGNEEGEVPSNPYLDKRQVVNTVNALAGIIKPFSSFDLSNTVLGRVIGPTTPLAQIGTVLLAKQFAQTVISNASREVLPAINFINLFDGDPDTKFIAKNKDYEITVREGQSNIGRIVEALVGTYDYLHHGYPFSKYKKGNEYKKYSIMGHNKEFIENTGKAQLEKLYKNINVNTFKLEDSGLVYSLNSAGFKLQLGNMEMKGRPVFGFPDIRYYPFKQYDTGNALINAATEGYNKSEYTFLVKNRNYEVKEYGNNTTYYQAMGITEFDVNQISGQYDFNSENFGLSDSTTLVWGRDGVTPEYASSVGGLKEDAEALPNESNNQGSRFDSVNKWQDNNNPFEIETGLLSFTRQLLNSKGKYGSFDLTRKKFEDTNNNVHFNGSPLDTHPDDGVKDTARRHSMADQYDRYAKAIRFDGNKIYDGNENSVIYKSVVPKFAPSSNKQNIDNSNLMFSIENLAIQVRREDSGLGAIESERSITLPACEIGAQGGRLMWFPPYDVRFSESAVARWDTNSFIGRSEPIYTYNTSERLGNLSFKLLIDYPQQLLGYKTEGDQTIHKTISEFFAFGGKNVPYFDDNLGQKQVLITEKQKEKEELDGNKEYVEPNTPDMKDYDVYFPNGYPTVNQNIKTNVKENLYLMGYEDGNKTNDDPGGVDNELNVEFINELGLTSGFDPNAVILEYFNPDDSNLYNADGKPFTKIIIGGSATSLYYDPEKEEEENKKLSVRRQEATKSYIEELIRITFDKPATEMNIKIITNSSDAVGSSQSEEVNGTEKAIHTVDAKKERYGSVQFARDSEMVKRQKELDGETKAQIQKLNEEISTLDKEIKETKRKMIEYSPCIYKSNTKEDGIGKGFSSFRNSKFNPVFHSQTPEDFHRRLTFLQQCTKQGESVRYISDGVNSSVNSVFGRQPVCIFRYGDFMHTKVVIDNISFSYEESTWDLNPEGFGMQPMICEVSIQLKILGGQSLRAPIDALQNAISFNYYANSTYTNTGVYADATLAEEMQIHSLRGGDALDKDEVDSLKNLGRESNFTLPQLQKKGVSSSIGKGGTPEKLG